MSDTRLEALAAVWDSARAEGSLGPVSSEELFEHATGYLSEDLDLRPGARCVDLGTGVGVPGLLLAMRLPHTQWRLLDASARRCAIAGLAVGAVGLADRVEVVHGRADELAHDPGWREANDLVVARLFGPPSEVAECGLPLLTEGGSLVVSVSAESADVWSGGDLDDLGAYLAGRWETCAGSFMRVRRSQAEVPSRFPRRFAARRRDPIF